VCSTVDTAHPHAELAEQTGQSEPDIAVLMQCIRTWSEKGFAKRAAGLKWHCVVILLSLSSRSYLFRERAVGEHRARHLQMANSMTRRISTLIRRMADKTSIPRPGDRDQVVEKTNRSSSPTALPVGVEGTGPGGFYRRVGQPTNNKEDALFSKKRANQTPGTDTSTGRSRKR